jgi:ornithine cyclodeaminase/alanine dehydrogenase-like protein (mu-crystallin family)
MTLVITNQEIASLLNMNDCIEAIEQAFHELGAGQATSRPRTLTYSPLGPDHFYLFSCMDSSLPSLGVHILRLTSDHVLQTTYNGLPRRDKLPRAPGGKFCGLIMLFSLETLEPLALIQDAVLNKMMVGATSGIAAKYMSRPESRSMALLGSGWLAHTQVLAHCAVRPIERIKVFSPNKEHREAFCRTLQREVEAELIPVAGAQIAIEGTDIVACATNSYEPVFDGNWLTPGHHVGTVTKSEFDETTAERAAILGTQALDPATFWNPPGIEPKEFEWFRRMQPQWNRKLRALGKIVAGVEPGRNSPADITLFGAGLSHGLGIQYAPAVFAYRRALAQGIGYQLPTELFLEDFHP